MSFTNLLDNEISVIDYIGEFELETTIEKDIEKEMKRSPSNFTLTAPTS